MQLGKTQNQHNGIQNWQKNRSCYLFTIYLPALTGPLPAHQVQ